MNEKGTSPGIFEKLIAPIIVGVVVLLGQWLIQPMIGEATSQKVELLNTKQVVYLDALKLLDRLYLSFSWEDEIGKPTNPKLGERPKCEEFNQCFARLLLVEDNKAVSDQFLCCCGYTYTNISGTYRKDLINLMRRDLYGRTHKDLVDAKSPFFLDFDKLKTLSRANDN